MHFKRFLVLHENVIHVSYTALPKKMNFVNVLYFRKIDQL